MTVKIRRTDTPDAIWDLLSPVFRAGDSYAIDPDISREDALAYWFGSGRIVFLAEEDTGQPLGTYYIRRNHDGGGSHVCNCGYVTGAHAQGRGVARAMLVHSQTQAREMGFRAMQFNFVIGTNLRAIDIWQRDGFEIVGRLPGAFHHPSEGYVDALVMMKSLLDNGG